MPSRPPKQAPSSGTTASRTVLELAEEAEDRFDEACEHARQAPGHEAISLGPSLAVPMGRLRAGRLAWSREVRAGDGVAELVYVLDPTVNGPGRSEIPLVDVPAQHLLLDLPTGSGSPVRLVGIGDPKRAPKPFRSFATAVRAELASDSE